MTCEKCLKFKECQTQALYASVEDLIDTTFMKTDHAETDCSSFKEEVAE